MFRSFDIRWIRIGFLILGVLGCTRLKAQDVLVPIDVQVPLMLKATGYDRNFGMKKASDGTVTVGICYQPKFRQSAMEMEKLTEHLGKQVVGFKLKMIPIAITETADLGALKEWSQLSVLYITTLRGVEMAELLKQAQQHGVLTVCTDPVNVQKGVSMGFDLQGGRPHFLINRESSIKEGCDFSSQLLKLATVY